MSNFVFLSLGGCPIREVLPVESKNFTNNPHNNLERMQDGMLVLY